MVIVPFQIRASNFLDIIEESKDKDIGFRQAGMTIGGGFRYGVCIRTGGK